MATFTITAAQNIDELASKAGGDTYNINGGTLTIDQDSRGGLNGTTSASIGVMALSATLGGTVEIDARNVRLIPYNSGTGNVPAWNTSITIGGASGKLIGVYSALNVASTATGAAMPVSGWIKVKQWNGVAYSAGALSGIGASATGADVAGWIEVVADEALNISVNRLNLFRVRGAWFELGTTDGNRATTYQIPSNGVLQYHGGVWVETGTSTDVYEFYPCAGTATALAATIATDAVRGKYCWITSAGVLRFGHDGTNSTGGYIPPSGRRVRIPNVFLVNCTTAARTANVLPNATLATRPEFATTGGGALDINYASCSWYLNVSQAYSFNMTNTAVCTAIVASEIASYMTWSNVGVGQEAANTQIGLTMSLCFAGGSFTDVTITRAAQAATGTYVASMSDLDGFTFTNCKFRSLTKAGNATSGSITATRVNNTEFVGTVLGGGRMLGTTCTNCNFTTTTYYDHPATTTGTAIPMYAFDIASRCNGMKFDGLDFGGLTLCQPYSGILNIGAAGCTNIKLRNLGTYEAPLDMGGAYVDATWTRSTTTMTVTKTAHGLKTGDLIAVNVCSDVAPKAVTTTTATLWTVASAPTADTFTVTVTNAGQTAGQFLSYYPTMAGTLVNLANGAAANDIRIQRCYTPHLRTGVLVGDNSSKNILLESVFGTEWGVQLVPELNATMKMIQSTPALTAQTACYGTHFFDFFTSAIPANVNDVAWSRVTTVASVTSNAHGLRVGDLVLVTATSDASAITKGQKTLTQIAAAASPQNPANVFNFTCLNAGGASGTLSFVPLHGRFAIQMNETTAETASQVTLSGGAAFTAAGGLYMPSIGQYAIFETPYYVLGHSSFPIAQAVMAGGTIGNYDITYAIDTGSGYSAFKNLHYTRAGGGGSNGSTNVTMTSTTGVAVGDYVFGTNIAPNAKVSSITNATTIVVDTANVGTVSGTLVFNQLPSEAALPSTGFKIKVKIATSTVNATAITSLYFYTLSTATTRAYTYPLDTVAASLSLTGLKANSEVRVFRTSDDVELAGIEDSGTSFTYNYSWTGVDTDVYIVIHHLNYLPIRYDGQTLGQSGLTLPIQQVGDRQYSNPA